jgi:hypothetical protein
MHELDRFESLKRWMSRMREFGHGRSRPMTAEEALEVARLSSPMQPRTAVRQAEDPAIGSMVEIRAADYAKDSIVGDLSLSTTTNSLLKTRRSACGSAHRNR